MEDTVRGEQVGLARVHPGPEPERNQGRRGHEAATGVPCQRSPQREPGTPPAPEADQDRARHEAQPEQAVVHDQTAHRLDAAEIRIDGGTGLHPPQQVIRRREAQEVHRAEREKADVKVLEYQVQRRGQQSGEPERRQRDQSQTEEVGQDLAGGRRLVVVGHECRRQANQGGHQPQHQKGHHACGRHPALSGRRFDDRAALLATVPAQDQQREHREQRRPAIALYWAAPSDIVSDVRPMPWNCRSLVYSTARVPRTANCRRQDHHEAGEGRARQQPELIAQYADAVHELPPLLMQ